MKITHIANTVLQKTLQRTQTVLETLRVHMATPNWPGMKFLRDNVTWDIDPIDAEMYLEGLQADIEGMRRFISSRQILPWPDSSRGTSVTCWQMHLINETKIDQTEFAGAHSSRVAYIPPGFRQSMGCIEGRALGNGKQTKVPTSDFVAGGKYRGLYPLK